MNLITKRHKALSIIEPYFCGFSRALSVSHFVARRSINEPPFSFSSHSDGRGPELPRLRCHIFETCSMFKPHFSSYRGIRRSQRQQTEYAFDWIKHKSLSSSINEPHFLLNFRREEPGSISAWVRSALTFRNTSINEPHFSLLALKRALSDALVEPRTKFLWHSIRLPGHILPNSAQFHLKTRPKFAELSGRLMGHILCVCSSISEPQFSHSNDYRATFSRRMSHIFRRSFDYRATFSRLMSHFFICNRLNSLTNMTANYINN